MQFLFVRGPEPRGLSRRQGLAGAAAAHAQLRTATGVAGPVDVGLRAGADQGIRGAPSTRHRI